MLYHSPPNDFQSTRFLQMKIACIIPILQQENQFPDFWIMKPNFFQSWLKLCCLSSVSQTTKLVILLMLLSILQSSLCSKSLARMFVAKLCNILYAISMHQTVWHYQSLLDQQRLASSVSVLVVFMLPVQHVSSCKLDRFLLLTICTFATGVPQGSMLRPLLFSSSPGITHIVDACRWVKKLGVGTTL